MTINKMGPVSMRTGLAPARMETNQGWLGNFARSSFLAGVLKFGLPVAGALGAIGCGSETQGVQCETTLNMVPRPLALEVQNKALMSIVSGTAKFKMSITLKGEDESLRPGTTMSVKFFSQNGNITADADGKAVILDNSQPEGAACATDVRSCSPFLGKPGIVPFEKPRVNAEGARMFVADDGSFYAALGNMRDRTYGNLVYEYNHPQAGFMYIASRRVVDFVNETERNVWYQVDGNGIAVTGTDDIVLDAALVGLQLQPHMAYYKTDAEGKYLATETLTIDGNPITVAVPDATLDAAPKRSMGDPNFTLRDILLGKKDPNTNEWIIKGMVINENDEIDWSLLDNVIKKAKYTVRITDQRPGIVDPNTGKAFTMTLPEPVDLSAISNALGVAIDPFLFSNGQANMLIEFETLGDVATNISQLVWNYTSVAGVQASIKVLQESTDCM